MMNDSIHKTASGNVVYLELVDFSDKTDAEQIDLKSKFNALVKVALKVPQTHTRIVTDTVEGVIVTTLGAPEEVLQIAANMQNIVHQYNIRTTAPVLAVSYTHLDVYKRQHLRPAWYESAAFFGEYPWMHQAVKIALILLYR